MKVITANRLTDGRVVYYAADQSWQEDPDRALRLSEAEAERALERAGFDVLEVVAPYLIEIDPDAADFQPAGRKHVREGIRVSGPTAGSTQATSEV